MGYELIVRPEAENDIKDAFEWYEQRQQGLGYNFILQIDEGIALIQQNPYLHPDEYRGVRKYIIKRFPYKMLYLIDAELIILLAVLHHKRSQNVLELRIAKS